MPRSNLVKFVLAGPVALQAALPFFWRGIDSVRNRSPKVGPLIALGVAAAAVIITLVFVGQVLE